MSGCKQGGHTYHCTTLSWASVDFENQERPTKFCLGGKESWGTCTNGMFLCQAATLKENMLKCKTLKEIEGQKQADWITRDCNVLAARVLKPEATLLLDFLENPPGGFGRGTVTAQSELRNITESLMNMQVVTVSAGSSPQDLFDSFMMCAAYATKLAFGDRTFYLHNNMFTFSEKPRSLLQFLRKDLKLRETLVWFQDAFDTLMIGPADSIFLESASKFDLEGNDIVFNGECNCFPREPELCATQQKIFSPHGPHVYLNSGSFVGRGIVLEKLLDGVMKMIDAEGGGEWPTTDQGAFMEFCFRKKRPNAKYDAGVTCQVDSGSAIMRTMKKCDGRSNAGQEAHVLTGPGLHFNGKSQNRDQEVGKIVPWVVLGLERAANLTRFVQGCIWIFEGRATGNCVPFGKVCGQSVSDEVGGRLSWRRQVGLNFQTDNFTGTGAWGP